MNKKTLSLFALGLLCALTLPNGFAHASTLSNPQNNLGLVGYWPMDSLDGTNAADRSGNGNTGTTVNSPSLVKGKISQALSFNGTNQYVSAANSSSLNPNAVTVSGWAKANSFGGYTTFLNKQSGGVYQLEFTNNSAQAWVGTSGGHVACVSSISSASGTWYFYTLTYDSVSGLSLYINGVVGCSGASAGVLANNTGTLTIGGDTANGGRWFDGSIDDVRIYNRALSASEVMALYQNTLGVSRVSASPTNLVPNGLVGYWTFDGANTNSTANTTADVSGNGNTGTLVNMSTTTSPVMGRFGQAMSFNGTNQNVSIPYSSLLKPSDITLSAWFYFPSGNATGPTQTIMGSWFSGTWGWELNLGGSSSDLMGALKIHITSDGDGVSTSNGSHVFSTGTWQLITATYDSATGVEKVYANGTLAVTRTITAASLLKNTAPLEIGATYDNGAVKRFFAGSIDEVRMYNRALSASEVKTLYNAGAPGGGAVVGQAPVNPLSGGGLVGYWPFDGNSLNWATGQALDMSGSGNNGTLVSMSTTTSPVAGKIGQALSFNGTNQWVSFPDSPSLHFTYFTGAVWFKTTNTNKALPLLVSSTAGSFRSPLMMANSTGSGGAWQDGTIAFWNGAVWTTYALGAGKVGDGKWHLMVATAGNSDIRIYWDGVQVAQSSSYPNNFSVYAPYRIGSDALHTALTPFVGTIDDVRIYNRVLSGSEVKTLYNLGH